jgi:hypothetical protein
MTLAYDISLACRLLVAAVFTVSVFAKVHDRSAWRSYSSWLGGLPLRPLHREWAPAALTGSEAAVVILAVVPATASIGLAAASALCLALTIGLAIAVRRGSRQPCHCFGSSSEPLSLLHVTRNALLLVFAVTGVVCAIASAGAPDPAQGALAAIGGLAAALLIIFFGDLADLFRPPPNPGFGAGPVHPPVVH